MRPPPVADEGSKKEWPRSKFDDANSEQQISGTATGIVRRIDDLGRVVIPKEIRRTMRIREGDSSADNIDTFRQVLYCNT